jgi:phage head maturation protease
MIINILKLLGIAAGGAVAGALVGGAVGYVIDYLDKARIEKEIEKEIQKKRTNAIITKAIVENINRGNVNVVSIGLFSEEERIDTLTIKAKAISSDIKLYENLLESRTITRQIIENIKRGNVDGLEIGLFSNEERIDTLTIKAKAISSDIKLYENLL